MTAEQTDVTSQICACGNSVNTAQDFDFIHSGEQGRYRGSTMALRRLRERDESARRRPSAGGSGRAVKAGFRDQIALLGF